MKVVKNLQTMDTISKAVKKQGTGIKVILINWETLEVKERGVLAEGVSPSVYKKINEEIKDLKLVWLAEPK